MCDVRHFWFTSGPLANLLTKKFSHRSVVMLGAVMVVIGIFCMPWTNSLHAMIVLYGLLTGNACFPLNVTVEDRSGKAHSLAKIECAAVDCHNGTMRG